MKGSNKSKFIYGAIGTLALCGASAFLLFKDNFISKEFSVVINGKNEYQSTLNVELRNSDLTTEDFEYQWWYKEYVDSNDKFNIDGATSYEYKIEDGLVGKYIGVTVVKKDNKEEVYEDVTDSDENNTVTVSPVTTILNLEKSEGIYNGEIVIGNYADVSSNADVIYTYYTDSMCSNKTTLDTGAIVEGGAPIDAGKYYVQASVEESVNYKAAKSECVEHVINPADINVIWNNGNYVYNGESQGPSTSVINDITTEQIVVENTTAVDAGKYISEVVCGSVIGGRGKCSNFNLVNNTQQFEISKVSTSVELLPVTSTYTGNPIFANEAITGSAGEISYTYYTDSLCTKMTTTNDGVSIDGSAPIDAGRYYVQATYVENGNIKETKSDCVAHTIEPKIISVEWGNREFTYDGGNKSIAASTVTDVDNEAMILSSSTATNVGIYNSTASCLRVNGGRGKCSNYWLVNNENTFVINKATPKVKLESKIVTYNGDVVLANEASTNSNGEITYKYYSDSMCTNLVSIESGASNEGGAPIDAGSYYVKAFVNESWQYGASSSGCVSHIIKPIDVNVDVNSITEQYDRTLKKNSFSVNYNKLDQEEVIFDSNGYVEPGVYLEDAYCLRVNGGREKCSNYNVVSDYEKLKIIQATGSVELDDFSKEYDNNFTQTVASTNSEANLYYKYYSDSNCSVEILEPVSVGKYYVKAYVDSTSRYTEASSACKKYTINKKTTDAIWTFNESGYKYNGQLQGPSVKVKLADGLYYDYESTKEVEVGTYSSTIVDKITDNSLFDLANYSILNDVVGYSISEATPVIVTDSLVYNISYPNNSVINYSIYSDTGIDTSKLDVRCYTSDASVATCIIDKNSVIVTPIDDGSAVITLSTEQSENYNETQLSFDVNVSTPTYLINLYYNDGSNMSEQLIKNFEESLELPSVSSIYNDYRFLGWSTSENGDVIYNAGDLFTNDGNASLFAIWKDMVLVDEDFEDLNTDSNITINGVFNVYNGVLRNLSSELENTSEIKFTAKYDSILSFDYGKYYELGNVNKLVIVLEGSDGTVNVLLTDESLEVLNGSIEMIKLDGGITYTLKISQTTDSLANYGYIDNLSVVVNEVNTLSREVEEFTWRSLIISVNDVIKDTWNNIIELVRSLFK